MEVGKRTSRWDNKMEFFMAAISYTIGLSNLWRFPYIVYSNGGAAFLIPYFLAMIIIGFPMVTLDLTLGQYGRRGPFGVWNLCPLFQGIGWSMVIVNFMINTYFVMVMAYCIYYMAASFSSTLPWATCDNSWNTASCVDAARRCSGTGGSFVNNSCVYEKLHNVNMPTAYGPLVSPSQEYFNNRVLDISHGFDYMGEVQWSLALCLLLAWILIVVGLSMGPKSWGKLSYVTALLPYAVLIVLLIPACQKKGAGNGILYYIVPDFTRLADERVWYAAASQVFFSLGCGYGAFITIGKYNHSRTNPIIAAGVLVLADFLTSFFCGFVIFAIIGQMAAEVGQPVAEVASSGFGLAFIAIPHAVMSLPVPQFWSVVFFLMLANLVLGSAIPAMATILDSLTEEIQSLSSRRNRFITLICLAALSFFVGLVYTTNGGIYVLTLIDLFSVVGLVVLCLLEVLIVSWVYGTGRLLKDLSSMTGWRPGYLHFFTIFWRAVCPIAILLILIAMSIYWFSPQYGSYVYPLSANFVGWMLTFCELLPIAVVIIYKLCMVTSKQELRNLIRPTAEWGAEARQSQNPDTIYPTTETHSTSKV